MYLGRNKCNGLCILVFLLSLWGHASLAHFESFRNYYSKGQLEEAKKSLQASLEKEKNIKALSLGNFALGVTSFKQNNFVEAIVYFDKAIEEKDFLLVDLARFYKAESLRELGKFKEAREEYTKAEATGDRNSRTYLESEFALAKMDLNEKRYKGAHTRLVRLARRMRGDEKYPDVLYNLMRAELKRGRKWMACRHATRLYSRHPSHKEVALWGVDLQKAKVDDRVLGCIASLSDQRSRLRNLQLRGLSDQAREEITLLRQRANSSVGKFHVDQLEANFRFGEGEVQKALNLLLPYTKQHAKNVEFLKLLAKVAALAGEIQMAVGAYDEIHKITSGRTARSALFHAAFLSYQYQDYDGAGRKFEQFIKKYPRSGLSRDSKWHLAWIRYLKSDFQGAFEGFKKIVQEKSRKKYGKDRAKYWMAMSLYRLNKLEEAKAEFLKIASDRSNGFYALAARSRLSQFTDKLIQRSVAQKSEPVADVNTEPSISPSSEENESEDDEKTISMDEEEESNTSEIVAEEVEEAESQDGPFKKANLVRRFSRANDLIDLGFHDWAIWELYEIEKRTSKQEHLKVLVSKYEQIRAYHRSSYISQVFFSKERLKQSLPQNKESWSLAYPRAYERSVSTFSRAYDVPEEFIWAIMRAESRFKYDVRSPVGAMGLMQIMPYTGTHIARFLKITDFEPSQLFDTNTNIRMGTWYLRRLLKLMEGNIALAAASYNAGPHRVRRWIKNFGNDLDLDEFIEHIPFVETRNYVKKVVHNFNIYMRTGAKATNEEAINWLSQSIGVKVLGVVESRENWDET